MRGDRWATNVKYISMTKGELNQRQFTASTRGYPRTAWEVTCSVYQCFNIYREVSTPALPNGSIVLQVGNIQLCPSSAENCEGLVEQDWAHQLIEDTSKSTRRNYVPRTQTVIPRRVYKDNTGKV